MKSFELWFKEHGSKKWKKSSLSMKDENACKKHGEKLKDQEGWSAIHVCPAGVDPNKSTTRDLLAAINKLQQKLAGSVD